MNEKAVRIPRLQGLVLAGGSSRRMGTDKGSLNYGGSAAVARAHHLLETLCKGAFVALRVDQSAAPAYRGLPQVIDSVGHEGPAAGLLSAWQLDASSAWLVLATDMPFVDTDLLAELLVARDAGRMATAFVNDAGIPEPLCAIWEPAAAQVIAARARAGRMSLREILETESVRLIRCREPGKLRSIDTPDARAAVDPTGA